MVKIPISRDNSGKKIVNNQNGDSFSDIKKPIDLKSIKFGSKSSSNFKKFLLITIPILVMVFISVSLFNWYRNYQGNKQAELEGQIQEPFQSAEVVEVIEATSTPEEIIEIIEKVIISETGIGYLNVREGAGTSYSILTKVYPGESYVLLEEVEEWYKIELDDDQEGWIFKEYATKQ